MLIALMLGLSGSLGHCVGMCGPVAALFSRRASVTQSTSAVAFLHLGRLTTYTLLGLFVGGIGQVAGFGISILHQIQAILALLAANIAIYFALSLLGWMPSPEQLLAGWIKRWGSGMRIAVITQNRLGRLAPLGLGMFWGLLPCGMVLAALFTAVTSGSAFNGALNMLAFGVGTLPSLLAVRWLAGRAYRPSWPRYAAAVIMLVFGLQFALRGLSVWGVMDHMMVGEVMLW